jgi:hypothetical protein
MKISIFAVAALVTGLFLVAPTPVPAVPITINYLDAAGKGFKDPTLGPARRAAFEITMYVFSVSLKGTVPITVDTAFSYDAPEDAGYSDGWPNTFLRNFNGVPAGVWYPSSLANQLTGVDNNPNTSDMTLVFNGELDINGGPSGERWYYGWDGNAGGNVDFITEVAHGFFRGAGMYTLLNPKNGEYYVLGGDTKPYPDIMTTKLSFVWDVYNIPLTSVPANLRVWALNSEWYLKWTGQALTKAAGMYVPMYAPAVPAADDAPYGVADHFHPSVGGKQIMWPWYVGPCHDLGYAKYLLMDIGWQFYF